jgi:hypothetical protein
MSERVSFPALSLHARSLDIPSSGANRMPFRGVLTRIDEPSDSAPHGSNGKRVLITKDAATRALDSLLGMAVNYGFDDHKPQEKIGVIFGSEIVGNELHIHGVIYAADFPEVAEQIKANRDMLGFSFEAREIYTNDPTADPVPIVGLSFTGAAILLKDKAAYHKTSIFASSEQKGSEMFIPEEMSQKIHAAMSHPKAKLSGAQKFNKLSDYLLSCSDPDREKLLDDIVQAAPNLPIATLKKLAGELSAAAKAKEAKSSAKAQRIARLQAALENQTDDPLIDSRVRLVRGSFRRLGLGDINDHSKNGIDPFEIDKACKAAGWKSTEATNLKIQASAIGLME